jgi:hypothetical protein
LIKKQGLSAYHSLRICTGFLFKSGTGHAPIFTGLFVQSGSHSAKYHFPAAAAL